MCGIAGLIHSDPSKVRGASASMCAKMRHRGPDDEGVTIMHVGSNFLGLVHRRLSILDLSTAGHQPMVHGPTGCQIVFNGEIYTFRTLRSQLERDGDNFQGGSDTEVLLMGLVRHGS